MTSIRPATGIPGVAQGMAAAITAGVAAHILDRAARIDGPAVFALSCLAAVAAYVVVGLLAAMAYRS